MVVFLPTIYVAVLQDFVCVLYARICPIEEGVEWWYTTYRCNRKVYVDEKMFFCESCNRHVLAVYPRLNVEVMICFVWSTLYIIYVGYSI